MLYTRKMISSGGATLRSWHQLYSRFLTLATKRRRRDTAIVWRFLSVRPSVRRNPPVLNGKGRLRESTHSRYTWHKGIVVMLSPAQWCSSVQLLPVCVYMAPTSST